MIQGIGKDIFITEKLRMYSFCRAFHCSPEEYNNTSCEDIDALLLIHKEFKELEREETERANRG